MIFGDGSTGGFLSFGGFAGGPGWGYSYPTCPNDNNWAFGAYAGGGVNIFVTNANNILDLSGPFRTYSLNVGWGLRALSLQLSIGENAAGETIRVFGYGGPLGYPTGVGYGFSMSAYNTNTVTTSGGGQCPCQ